MRALAPSPRVACAAVARSAPRRAAAARTSPQPRALGAAAALCATPVPRHQALGARGRASAARRGVAVVRASDAAYEQPTLVFSSAQLAQKNAPNGIVAFLASMTLPLALVAALAAGVTWPDLGIAAKEAGAVQLATVTVFALTGLSLRLDDVRTALNSKRAALYGLLSCLGLSALLAPLVLTDLPQLLSQLPGLPALHDEFFAGLALLCCVPTTLSTGVILARQANANDALVLLIMLLTNVIGVLTLPFALAHVFGTAAGTALEPLVMLEGLAWTVLAPLLAGVVARLVPGVPGLVDRLRAYIRLLQQACLVATPWMTISESTHQLVHIDSATLALVAAVAFALHLTLLFGNALLCALLRLGGRGRAARRTRRALLLATSQKTLPVSVAVLAQLGNSLGEPGLVLLPCIFFHLVQIVFGSVLVSAWRSLDGV